MKSFSRNNLRPPAVTEINGGFD